VTAAAKDADRPIRLAIVTSHPIQYNAPLFRALAALSSLTIKVFYSWAGTASQIDPEFGRAVAWDVPLLDGYDHVFVPNISNAPGTHHFKGLDNPAMPAAIEEFSPDAVLVYGWASRTHLRVLRHFHGRLPVFFRGDSTLASGVRGLKRVVRGLVLRWVYRHVDMALYVGRNNRDYFLAHGLGLDRLTFVPYSVDESLFAPNAETDKRAAAMRRDFGISDSAVVFLLAGKLIDHKNPQLLMQAFNDLAYGAGAPDTHLVFVGTGPMQSELQANAAHLERVHFAGFQNQRAMPSVYRMADVVVLPSKRETWGLSINEAMLCERPVIVSDAVGCAPDLAEGKAFAAVFPQGDGTALKGALRRFAGSRRDCQALGKEAAKAIEGWLTQTAAVRLADAVRQYCRPKSA